MSENLRKEVDVFFEICRESATLPSYARKGDAGMDVYAAEDVVLDIGETKIVPTGLKVAIPDGYEIQVRPRSGISFRTPLRVSNSPGTIDSGYRDEVGIILTNTSSKVSCEGKEVTVDDNKGTEGVFKVRRGDRIAQFVLQEVPKMNICVVESVKDIGFDRRGGFGSTGTK